MMHATCAPVRHDWSSQTSKTADTVCLGRPRFNDHDLAAIAARAGPEQAWATAFERFGTAAPARVSGDFAVAIRADDGRTYLAVDRFAIRTLCYRVHGEHISFAERADMLGTPSGDIEPQALLDYLYFHVIPAPRTVFRGVNRLPAGHCALFENGRLSMAPWWTPRFVEHHRQPFQTLRAEFCELLHEAVHAQVDGRNVGCFLSGGTDSSTVAGVLSEVTGHAARTFSIGFDAEGYDEMEYARIAARHFDAEHHEYYVTPDDLVRSIPDVAAWYDQPFGNSSVVPAYYCARMAKEAGVEHLLAGDGGDELFGGNTRYAKQRVFALYERVPGALRKALLEPGLLGLRSLARAPGVKKAVSYVEQARVPMPDRLQMYNLLMRLGLGDVLTPQFLAGVDPEEPLHRQREVYAQCQPRALINRMLAFDWKYTLADNDLPKVIGATSLAEVSVGFPLLDDRLVDFSLRLAPPLKLKGLQLRWFFKEALRGFLPDQIIAKKKHGFGLPFGVWMTRHAGLKALALESLDSLRGRGIVRADFLDRLTTEYLPRAPGYYGEMVWILMMAEQWFRARARSDRSMRILDGSH